MPTSFHINAADLAFILRQIRIAEAHTGGVSLTQAIQNEYGVSATDANLVPFGLRTVDGSLNNLAPGQEQFGAADQPFPRMLDPIYVNDPDGDAIDFDGPGPAPGISQGNYGQSGNVVDADPRTISNLIVDQSLNNPAAIIAALKLADITGADATAAVAAIQAAHAALQAAHVAAAASSPAAIAALQAIVDTEVAEQAAAQGSYDAAVAADSYLVPAGLAAVSQAAADAVVGAMNTVGATIFGTNVDQTDIDNAFAAVAAAQAAVAAATAAASALAGLPEAPQALAVQAEMASLLGALQTYATGLSLGEPVSAADELQQVVDAAASAAFNANLAVVLSDALDGQVDPLGAVAGALAALGVANSELAAAQANLSAAQNAGAAVAEAQTALTEVAGSYGVEIGADGGVEIPNLSPDIGLSPSFNAWMTFFGQFFDHGLDLVPKAGNGKVYIPLEPDDPLITHGPDGIPNSGDEVPPEMAFMVVTRAGVDENGNSINLTTPFVDQNQTYTSHASHQVFLRAYHRVDLGDGPKTLSTGELLDGTAASGSKDGAIANWGEVKAQALSHLGIRLTDYDIGNVPLLATDAYGELILGPNGFAQIVMMPDLTHATPWHLEGNPDGSVTTAGAYMTGHAFLDDIAHHAAPGFVDHDHNPATAAIQQIADTDPGVGDDGDALTYDDEMLNAHFITGDGRGNENIALSAVHSVFHSEHNRILEVNKHTILETAAGGDFSFLNEWLLVDVTEVPADLSTLVWDGERMFQAARFTTEMQYQHLVFEEYARRIQPAVDPFVFTHSPDVDAAIVAEFAHTVYRFGHSMLTDTVERLGNDLQLLPGETDQSTLVESFLNPQMFLAGGADLGEVIGNIVRGTTRDVGNEMDEFIVPALQSNLLGLPLDLAAINIARGRDTGIPSLNEARKQFYADYGLADLKPYASWLDFAQHIKHPASIINFIAAYGTHALVSGEATLEGKRGAAMAIVTGVDQTLSDGREIAAPAAADRSAFLNATGAYATTELGGMNNVDFWIGGLAEELNEFGGMLGSTFNLVFEFQMEQLQTGDRFYYLSRTQGTNMLNQLEPNTFTDLVMRNSALGDDYATHLNAALFVTPDYIFELDRGIAQADYNPDDPLSSDPIHNDPFLQLIDPRVARDYSGATLTYDPVNGVNHDVGGYLKYSGGEHVVLGGTEGNDTLIGDKGIDALWGDGGDDYLNAGMESDQVFAGDGDDIIEDPFGDDMLRGEGGNDVISAGSGLDLIFGGAGNDYIIMGADDKTAFGDEGDDFILGGTGNEFILGGEGNDWIEGGPGFDVIAGENSELFFNSPIIGHDVAWGQQNDQDYDLESGDDIALSGPGIQRYEGMFGFDWASAKYDLGGANYDFAIPIFTTIVADILRDRFDQVEAASGWIYDDILQGDDRGHKGGGSSSPDSVPTELFADHLLTQEGIDRIAGLNDWMGGFDGTDARQTLFGGLSPVPGSTAVSTFRDGNILMGGDGNDLFRGRGGYDLIDGDAWLNVRIKIVHNGITYSAESLNPDTTVAGPHAGRVFFTDADGNPDFSSPAFGGATLNSLMLAGTINPGNMSIVREILYDETPDNNIDTAMFQGTFAEYEIEGSVDLNGDGDFNDAGEYTGAVDVNGDGFISVRDRDTGAIGATVDGVVLGSRGALTDDTDLLKNIEQLQFADRIVTIAGTNNLATGTVTINDDTPFNGLVTPYVGQVLTATLTDFADADGIPLDPANGLPVGLSFEWQTTEIGSNAGWSTIQTSVTYTVRSVDPGHALRAVAVFKDNKGITERIASASTDNPTSAYSVFENSADGVVVGLQIPFSVDYDPQPINGQPPADVDLTTIHHEIDPANDAGGRFTVILNGVDFNGFPRFSLVVAQGGPGALNYEAGVHTNANQSHQFVDNQYQVVINTYDAPGGALIAVRQFTVLLKDVEPELVAIAPVIDLSGSADGNVADDFSPAAYDGNDGSTDWAGAWVETNDGGGAASGDIDVNGGRLRFGQSTDGNEIITRSVDLSGATNATLSFSWEEDDRDAGEDVLVQAFNGTVWQTIGTMAGSAANGSGIFSMALTPAQIGAHTSVRFATVNGWENGENFYVDNVNLSYVKPAMPGANHVATFTEGGASVAISQAPTVADADSPVLLSATITVTNAQPGDVLNVGSLPAGMSSIQDQSVPGEVSLYLIGMASQGAYQAAIQAVTYANTSQNPNPVPGASPRVIEVSVYDGQSESNVATTSVTVNAVNDAPDAINDSIVTNIAGGSPIVVPEWMLLANDADPDSALDITAIGSPNGLGSVSLVTTPGAVTVTHTVVPGGSFIYTASDGTLTDTASVAVTTVLPTSTVSDAFGANSYGNNDGATAWSDNWTEVNDGGNNGGAGGGDIDINGGRLRFGQGTDGNESVSRAVDLTGATGATLSFSWQEDDRDAGEDVLVQAFNGTTWDTIGTMAGSVGNGTGTFSEALSPAHIGAHSAIRFAAVNRWENGENFYIDDVTVTFTRPGVYGGAGSQILVGDAAGSTFTGGIGNDFVLAGAGDDAIFWNANLGTTDGHDYIDGGEGIDTFTVNGNDEEENYRVFSIAAAVAAGLSGFSANAEIIVTRTVTGADPTVADIIAELDNIDEIVINTGGGADVVTVVGDFAPTTLAYNTIRVNGSAGDTVDLGGLTSTHRVLLDTGEGPQQAVNPNFVTAPEPDPAGGSTTDPATGTTPAETPTSEPVVTGAAPTTGAELGEVISGTAGDDTILALGGNDTVFGGAGDDNAMGGAGQDIIFGDAGADRIFGDEGDDFISGGKGNDMVFGGVGNDRFVAEVDDGNDSYFGGLPGSSAGVDTLDMSAITANISANLGGGQMDRGAVYSSETGHDTLWNVANIVTGAGNDIITAGNQVNVIDGGSGNDIFRFETATAANGDTISTFQPGDKIDLSGMDANADLAGIQSFSIVSDGFSGKGQLMISQEVMDDEIVTVVSGNVSGGDEAEFRINIKGAHDLSPSDFTL